jgi:hypothetical protein
MGGGVWFVGKFHDLNYRKDLLDKFEIKFVR